LFSIHKYGPLPFKIDVSLYGSTSNLALNKSQFLIKFIAKSYDMFVVHKGNAKMAFSVGF
jgi:hypothetical protein